MTRCTAIGRSVPDAEIAWGTEIGRVGPNRMVREQAAARPRRLRFSLQVIEAVGGSRIAIVDAQI
jgi:hypothetical protein